MNRIIMPRLFISISFVCGLDFLIHFLDISCGFPRGSKISEILVSFRKARSAKISDIYDADNTST